MESKTGFDVKFRLFYNHINREMCTKFFLRFLKGRLQSECSTELNMSGMEETDINIKDWEKIFEIIGENEQFKFTCVLPEVEKKLATIWGQNNIKEQEEKPVENIKKLAYEMRGKVEDSDDGAVIKDNGFKLFDEEFKLSEGKTYNVEIYEE